jgi:hypothetical protein
MTKKFTRNRGLLLAIVAAVGLVFLWLNTRLGQREAPTGSLDTPTSGTEPVVSARWGKYTMGPVTGSPNPWTQIRSIFYRLRYHHAGIRLPIAPQATLNTAMTLYYLDLVPRPNSFVVYYSPGLDGGAAYLAPFSKTNLGQVVFPPASLDDLLAFNGYGVVRLRRNVIKVFPSPMARLYSDALVNDPSPDP